MATTQTVSVKKNIKRIPVTIISGFLGSGKTTLVNYILKSEHGLKPVVFINDFGKVNIDLNLIENIHDDGTVNLSNGCICCSIRGDLISALIKQCTKPAPPNFIIIECSGVSDPSEIVTTFMSPILKPFLKIDGIITVIDAQEILTLAGKYAALARAQIEYATVIILNKTDLVTQNDLEKLREWISNITPKARILQADHGHVPLELILGVGNFDPILNYKNKRSQHSAFQPKALGLNETFANKNTHRDVFSSFSYVSQRPLESKYFKQFIQQLPSTIYRAKGFVYLADFPDTAHIFHVVGRWAYLKPASKWGKKKPCTSFVMIGEQNTLDEIALKAQIDACFKRNISSRKELVDAKPNTRQLTGLKNYA